VSNPGWNPESRGPTGRERDRQCSEASHNQTGPTGSQKKPAQNKGPPREISILSQLQGEGDDHIQAARAEDGSFIIAYLTFGRYIAVHMDKLSGTKIKAQWYDPREGTWIPIGQYSNKGVREFVAPSNGDQNDWILVLEDMEKNYPSS
jgi:hypothetical protein